ncbi:TPA: pyridoxamine 5'-phosphate oxidase family protein [Vibrio parahaemolyticus]|uniref:MSMEG_1061 family FMN-dependent PPOX-type flavoprotein n=1 Tax=Vibrio parahaemolyticus TaxID=670 RepID=UPI0004146960|nr:MSMEG_1061 family FMN-dependent PPOX-type flavoprotein [Vibrio parahaemolyticus]EKB7281926.1 pyridoxamine 5'-phosphate oxidase family protein [Vibrio parahaemolyticus]KJR22405.1 phosphohydrolase [Vibrio parahaemolyticus]MBE5196192.1 pyridoxamine 5'-phosphate oxidase family protein [Vibrio parahaemolyticus]HCE1959951.1 pyridoxamine 5'-phosphate oxidase family protein [Vibrio parahaemolyticus]HCE2693382.1 pyridoxamine 5'-phosphate oxidase family protein [Vibrio parahaemolyticus]
MSQISSIEQLLDIYPKPNDKAKNKVLSKLDRHSITMIENCHFCILSSTDVNGFTDISPKGGAPGFVKVLDQLTILIPDSSGNNRIDSLKNIVSNPKVGMMFMVKGIDEVVRLKGHATIHKEPELLALCPDGNKEPKVVVKVVVESAYFHCAKAIMRGKLWSNDFQVERSILPSLAEIIKEQQKLGGDYVSQEQMLTYYESSL